MTERWREIADVIRERIESGEWKPQRRIPSQRKMAVECVSIQTVANAVAELRKRGYLWTLRHKGSYVRPAEDWQEASE
jgi:DNA-binding GntR family transcriptional regulator